MLKSLNQAQKKAVIHNKGPLLILAGAGSGKTRALTHRLAYLVKKRNISPLNILCLTFTNKAADEMKNRVRSLVATAPRDDTTSHFPYMGTFHSVCAGILRREIIYLNQGFNANFTIFDENDAVQVIKKIMLEINIDPKKFAPEAIKAYISRAKNELISPLKYKNLTDSIFTETVAKIYPLYEKKLQELNALDFDNLINKLIELFKISSTKNCHSAFNAESINNMDSRFRGNDMRGKNKLSILEKYQQQFKYILVDEYQDTNHSQYLLLKLLAQKHQNISVVGDDWQSIYRFRGADFRNILDFKKDYPQAQIIKLEKNYRSTGHILNAAQSIIKNNNLRSDKNLYSNLGDGEKVKLVEVRNQKSEGEFIIEKIKEFENNGAELLNQSVIL